MRCRLEPAASRFTISRRLAPGILWWWLLQRVVSERCRPVLESTYLVVLAILVSVSLRGGNRGGIH